MNSYYAYRVGTPTCSEVWLLTPTGSNVWLLTPTCSEVWLWCVALVDWSSRK